MSQPSQGSENNYASCGSEDEEMAQRRTWIKCQVSDLHFSHKPGHFQIQYHISALWSSEHRFSQDTTSGGLTIWVGSGERLLIFLGNDSGAVATKENSILL